MRRVIRIWYLTASCGATPERIWPVISPGRETTPVAAMELMIGVKPLRMARWWAADTASHRVLPRSSLASIVARSAYRAVWSVSRPRLTPVIVLPRIIPNKGSANCGDHQGVGWICVVNAHTVTIVQASVMDVPPRPIHQMQRKQQCSLAQD